MGVKGRNVSKESRPTAHYYTNTKTPHHSHHGHAGSGSASSKFSHRLNSGVGQGGFEGPMVAPWRKTVSIFKQPVTLVRTTSRETKPAPSGEIQAASRAGTARQEKPKQVFWSKRLECLRAMMPVPPEEIARVKVLDLRKSQRGRSCEEDENEERELKIDDKSAEGRDRDEAGNEGDDDDVHILDGEPTSVAEALALPSRILPVGPGVTEDAAAASLTSALQAPPVSGAATSAHFPPITGQTNPKKNLDSNPGVYTNPDQPLIHAVVVSEQDITAQEMRVVDARRRLEEARKHFG